MWSVELTSPHPSGFGARYNDVSKTMFHYKGPATHPSSGIKKRRHPQTSFLVFLSPYLPCPNTEYFFSSVFEPQPESLRACANEITPHVLGFFVVVFVQTH